MVGLLLMIFIKKQLAEHVKFIEHDSVKQGFAHKFGNKGAVIIKILIDNTEICFANVHLPAGDGKS